MLYLNDQIPKKENKSKAIFQKDNASSPRAWQRGISPGRRKEYILTFVTEGVRLIRVLLYLISYLRYNIRNQRTQLPLYNR